MQAISKFLVQRSQGRPAAVFKVGAFGDWWLDLLSSWGGGTAFCTQAKSTSQLLLGIKEKNSRFKGTGLILPKGFPFIAHLGLRGLRNEKGSGISLRIRSPT